MIPEKEVFADKYVKIIDPMEISDPISLAGFHVPFGCGEIEKYEQADKHKYVIHIQDAHCNYDAQIQISKLLKYIKDQYRINAFNLEGAAGPFDLNIFTAIKDKKIREKVARYFLEKGDISGAEYFAINEPENTVLWGVENKQLYSENLKIYREIEKDIKKISRYISFIRIKLNEIAMDVFNRHLLELYLNGRSYDAGEISFVEYMNFLLSISKSSGLLLSKYPNIKKISGALELERSLDFSKAEAQREILVRDLESILSRNERKVLVEKMMLFSGKDLSEREFNEYLLNGLYGTDLDPTVFNSFKAYTKYIKVFESVDYSVLMKEMNELKRELKQLNFTSKEQSELDVLLGKLEIIEDIFDFCLTRKEYDKYLQEGAGFSAGRFNDLLKNKFDLSKEEGRLLEYKTLIDRSIDQALDFYEYSFKRDEAFVRNIRFSEAGGDEAAILVAGGFHSDNLIELLKKKNISYISIVPNFVNSDNYESPYFDLLSGRIGEKNTALSRATEIFNIAVASRLSPVLAGYIWKESGVTAFDAAVIIHELLIRNDFKKRYQLVEDFKRSDFNLIMGGNNMPIVFGEEGSPEEVLSLKRIISEAKQRKLGRKPDPQWGMECSINIPKETLEKLGSLYELHGKRFIVDGERFVMFLEEKGGQFPFKISLRRVSDGKEIGYKEFALSKERPYSAIIGITERGDILYSDEYDGCIRGGMLEIREEVDGVSYRGRKLGRLLINNFGYNFPQGYVYETEIKNKSTLSDMFDGSDFKKTLIGSVFQEWNEEYWEYVDGLGVYHQSLSDMPETRKEEFLDKARIYGAFMPGKNRLEKAVFEWPAESDPMIEQVRADWRDAKMKMVKDNVPVQRSLFDELFGKGVLFSGIRKSFVKRFGSRRWRLYENFIAPLWEETVFFLLLPSFLRDLMGTGFVSALILSRWVHVVLHYFNDDKKNRFTAPAFISLLVLLNEGAFGSIYQGYFAAAFTHIIINAGMVPIVNHFLDKSGSNKLLGKGMLGDDNDPIKKMAVYPDYEKIGSDWLMHKSAKQIKGQTHGWNIQVSAGIKDAEKIFSVVQPILLKYEAPHIVMAGISTLKKMIESKDPRARKFISIFIEDLDSTRKIFSEIDEELLNAGFVPSRDILSERIMANGKRLTGESGVISSNMDNIEFYGDKIPQNRQDLYGSLPAGKGQGPTGDTIMSGHSRAREILEGTPEYERGRNIKKIISSDFFEALLNGENKIINGKELLVVSVFINHDGSIMPFTGLKKDKDSWVQKYGPLFDVQLGVDVDINNNKSKLHIIHETEKKLPLKALNMLKGTVQEINRKKEAKLLEFFNLWQERQNELFFDFSLCDTEDERGRLFFERFRQIIDAKTGKVTKDMQIVMNIESKKIRKDVQSRSKERGNYAVFIDTLSVIAKKLVEAYDIREGDYFETISVRGNVRRFCFKEIDVGREVISFTYPGNDDAYQINLIELDRIRRCSGENFIKDLKELVMLRNEPLERLSEHIREKNPLAGSYDTAPAIFRARDISLDEAVKEAEGRARREMIRDYLEYLNNRTGLFPDSMIEVEKLDGSKRGFIYKGVEINAGLIVKPLDQQIDRFYVYDIEKVKSVTPVQNVQKNFIGKNITGLEVRYEDKQFVCRDASGVECPVSDLHKVDYSLGEFNKDISGASISPEMRNTLLDMSALLNGSAPEFYVYNDIVEDLFGFSVNFKEKNKVPPGLIALWQGLFRNDRLRVVAMFHELGHYLLSKGLLEMRLDNGKIRLYSGGEILGAAVTIRSPHALRQITKAYIVPEYAQHYFLRALQIEFFGARDSDLSLYISENKKDTGYLSGRETVKVDEMHEFGDNMSSVLNFVSDGKISVNNIKKHVKQQVQRDNGRVTEKHYLYLKNDSEISFYVKRPDNKYVPAFRANAHYLKTEDRFTREAAGSGLSVRSRVFQPEGADPFLVTMASSGERLKVRHLIEEDSVVPENILYALGKLHGLGVMHCDLTHLILDNEYGPEGLNFEHIYVKDDKSIEFIDFGEAAHFGEKFAKSKDFIEEMEEVMESILNIVSIDSRKLVDAYEKGKIQAAERNKKLSAVQSMKAEKVIIDMVSERARAALGDVRQKRMDIIVMPASEEHISGQKDIDFRVRRKLSKDYGQETLPCNYLYSKGWRRNFKDLMRDKVREELVENRDNNPRILLYLPVSVDEIKSIYEKDGLLYDFRDIKESITIIAEENISPSGVIDEVMHVVLGKALLNYERFRQGDYGDQAFFRKEALERLEMFIKVLVENPEEIDLESDPEIVNKIIDGLVALKMKRINFSDITAWKSNQDAVLVAL